MKSKKKLINIIIYLFVITNINAQGIYPILSMPYSARSIALCSSGTTDSDYSISYNPSSINTDKIIFGFHSTSLPLDISYNRLETIIPRGNKIYFLEIKNIDYGQFYDNLEQTEFSAKETDVKFGIKKPFYDTFSGSISFEYIYSSISTYISQALVTSIGVRAETLSGQSGFSISIENNGRIFDYYNKSFEKINRMYRVSGYYKLKHASSKINYNFTQDSYNNSLGSISLESKIKSIIILRLGIGSIQMNQKTYFTNYDYSFGLGLKYQNYILDFGVKNINNIGLLSGLSIHYIIP